MGLKHIKCHDHHRPWKASQETAQAPGTVCEEVKSIFGQGRERVIFGYSIFIFVSMESGSLELGFYLLLLSFGTWGNFSFLETTFKLISIEFLEYKRDFGHLL